MATADGKRPFGLSDVKFTPLPGGTLTDVPIAKSLEWSIEYEEEELTGDDSVASTRYYNQKVTGSVEHGGIHPSLVAAITGGVVTTTGTGGTTKTVVAVSGSSIAPYVKLEGQAKSDDGTNSDFHVVIYKARFTNPSWTLEEGTWLLTAADFTGIPDDTAKLVDFVWNSTAAAIA
jgi:hypothetical protein